MIYPITKSTYWIWLLAGLACLASTTSKAAGVDSTSIQPASVNSTSTVPSYIWNAEQRTLSLTAPTAKTITFSNYASGPGSGSGYGIPQNLTCANGTIMTGLQEASNDYFLPASVDPSTAIQSGNYRLDPICSAADSLTAQCTQHVYIPQYNRLDLLTITCGASMSLPYLVPEKPNSQVSLPSSLPLTGI